MDGARHFPNGLDYGPAEDDDVEVYMWNVVGLG